LSDKRLKEFAMVKGRSFELRRHLPSSAFVLILLVVIAGFGGAFIYAGLYNVGADAPHSRFVSTILDELRESAIAHHSREIVPPADLDSAARRAAGASLYAEMCTSCHLAPGMERTEISQGLYPPAPELARPTARSAAEQFWIIKHGVKLSAMPAWGRSHNDELIWDMVAFVRSLSNLSPQQYEAAVANAPADHEEILEGISDKHRAEPTEAHAHSH
jgi:mono/diheme cytochrome c family protein